MNMVQALRQNNKRLNMLVYIYCIKENNIELLLVEYIFKVLVFWAIFSQWIIPIDVSIVDTDYE
jgi:hypothetical protein